MEENLEEQLKIELMLKESIKKFIYNEDSPPTIFRALLRQSQKANLKFNYDEFLFLQYNIDGVVKFIKKDIPASIIYLLREKLISASIRSLGFRLGKFDRAIEYWIKKMEKCELVKGHVSNFDRREIRYRINPVFLNISKLISEIIVEYHGLEKINKLISKNDPKSRISNRMAVQRYRSKRKNLF